MADLSHAIGEAIFAGRAQACLTDYDATVDAILMGFPAATADEIERGFQIAVELTYVRDAEMERGIGHA